MSKIFLFRFYTSMISPINFQTVNNSYKILPQKVSFAGKSDVVIIRSDDKYHNANSQLIYEKLRAGEFNDALLTMRKIKQDFNPNWVDNKCGLPLLSAVYNQQSFMAKLRAKRQQAALPEIMTRIVTNGAFMPDEVYKYTYSPFEQSKKWTYVEMALKNKDIYLLQLLSSVGATLDDYTEHEMAELERLANDEFAGYILFNAFADQPAAIAENRQLHKKISMLEKKLKNPLPKASEPKKEVSHSKSSDVKIKDLEEYRVNIGENIPATLDELGGMTKAKKAINDFIIRPWNEGTRELLKKNNIEMPNGFMMYGPPGCGKTFVAKVIAKQLGLPMFEVELGSVGNSYAYTTNNRLKKIFTELEKHYKKTGTPSILFLDEVDSVAASRKLSRSDWKRDEINTLISLLNNSSEKGIIVIGATNLIDNVDEAVLRTGRFDKKIEIGLPDKEERIDIIQKIIANKPILKSLSQDVEKLADMTDEKSCSDISASLNHCAMKSLLDGKDTVTIDDFTDAMKEIEYENDGERKVVKGFSTVS